MGHLIRRVRCSRVGPGAQSLVDTSDPGSKSSPESLLGHEDPGAVEVPSLQPLTPGRKCLGDNPDLTWGFQVHTFGIGGYGVFLRHKSLFRKYLHCSNFPSIARPGLGCPGPFFSVISSLLLRLSVSPCGFSPESLFCGGIWAPLRSPPWPGPVCGARP